MLQAIDKSQHSQHDAVTIDSVIHINTEDEDKPVIRLAETNTEEAKPELVLPKETDCYNNTKHDLTYFSGSIEEVNSDEGWQEANSKVRAGNGTSRNYSRRRPNIAKLNTNRSEYSNYSDGYYKKELIFPGQKAVPKTNSAESSPLKHSKSLSSNAGGDSTKLQAKTPVSRISPPSVSKVSTTMASKSVSYKEVALAPPGTVIKPMVEKVEEIAEEIDTEVGNNPPQTTKEGESNIVVVDKAILDHENTKEVAESGNELENSSSEELEAIPSSSNEEKPVEMNGSKLSAAAQPFSPGTFPLTQPLNSVAVTSVYDVIASQGMLADPIGFPPIAARVTCGPRSPLYSFQMKHGFLKYQGPIMETSGPKIMNPNAPEFVPGRAWLTNAATEDPKVKSGPNFDTDEKLHEKGTSEVKDGRSKKSSSDAEKSELARQILLSFIVKSVQNNLDPASESAVNKKKFEYSAKSSEAVANDSAIIKILYGNEGKEDSVSETGNNEQQKTSDGKTNNNGDAEGFVVVTKRRRNRQQFSNGVSGLYNQQSICASVR